MENEPGAKFPGAQGSHDVAAAMFELEPGSQPTHAIAEVLSLKRPRGQSTES